ncbi:hypothetical protein [Pedobacter rhizosphaerae]|uniref:Glycosyl transferases group 1 n=1 Tax=Pedobacter rhizosphaerae TaxID=390241 RepID=A0A1H9V4H9_9SPHI|nr:hypothetical protein [Pedobacter rhizosphaerae]SES16294.1 hypothetical protein SAMN04488023_13726 [Pedobacter rhizosphaerae]
MLKIKNDAIIYIFCAPNFATGGPEALHQLGHQLIKMGINAKMYYYPIGSDNNDPVHPFYKKYQVPYVTSVENAEANFLILPETSPELIFKKELSKINKVIWWLSVTNYYKMLAPVIRRTKRKPSYWIRKLYDPIEFASLEKIKEMNIANIGHSYFSMDHLKKAGIHPIGQISDYMNQQFFNRVNEQVEKEDMIIYNPVKNGEFLQKIIKKTPELNWVALQGLTPEEVASTMNRAKLYVDFGYHPGKERMPREACIMRCCMIIGREGSAAFDEDMPILDKYRFEKVDDNIKDIVQMINICLENYNDEIKNFVSYREALYMEEQKFEQAVKDVFVKV